MANDTPTPQAAPAASPAPAKASASGPLTVEAWVAQKGDYERQGARPIVIAGNPLEAHYVAAARVLCGWAIGSVVSESDYDAGVQRGKSIEIGVKGTDK